MQLPDRGGPVLEDIAPRFAVEGRPAAPDERPRAAILIVQPDYFRAMGISLVRGRGFRGTDRGGEPRVIVVNESLARTVFGGGDPLGARLEMESWVLPDQTAPEIVGVASDVTHAGLATAKPLIYVAMAQFPRWSSAIVVKTDGDPLERATAVRDAIHAFDPDLPIDDVRTLQDRIGASVARERFHATLLGALSMLAVALAALGLYGVLSFATARRTREIGLRMAMGAAVPAVLRLVLTRGLRLTLAGIAIGLAGALALGRVVESLLFGVSPGDPLALAAVAAALLAVATLAAWIPARRATRVDPVVALRHE
jgi:predicted permease